jgi:UDP-N-acetylmuramoyl-L-alanyl-D-glutamate--2,6-diaminopimelate ligase
VFARLAPQLATRGTAIDRLTSDSRRAAPGAAFFAWPGAASDGRRHIAQAIERGCAAVVWESEGFSWDARWSVPNVPVKDLRAHAGALAHAFYGKPSEALWVCGVTGTNGKTSCSQWLAALLSLQGERTAVLGTLGAGLRPPFAPVDHTTPDVLEVHRWLAEFRQAGAQAVAMEVSSHGLEQGRVNGVAFGCALFTNLTHDHLDYHGSMAAYAAAKARLFDAPGLAAAVLNLDDAFGVQLAERLAARGQRTIGYGLSGKPVNVSEFAFAAEIDETRVRIESTWGEARVRIPQVGRFSVANALGVLGCLVAKGLPFAEAAALLEQLPSVPGRMQRIGERPLVVVDYAHTPDALDKVLAALEPAARARGGRLVALFGAGGGRDAAKRPQMGLAASRRADRIVLTSDNPRGEDPLAIIEAIRAGLAGWAGECEVEPDRAKAIAAAIAAAGEADVLLLAGKGHEAVQEIGGKRLPFSDAAVAAAALARRNAS